MQILSRALAAVLLAAALVSCTSTAGGPPPSPAPVPPVVGGEVGSGPVDSRVPVEMRPVLEELTTGGAPGSPDVLTDEDGLAYRLGPSIGGFDHFEDVRVLSTETGGWAVQIRLSEEDTTLFGAWTAEHVGERLAIVVDGEVVTAPVIQSAIPGGSVQIVGGFTRDEARELAKSITG